MKTTRICKYKIDKLNPDTDVYIGRGSIWGNPYSHKEGTKATYIVDSVEEAIHNYKEYLVSNRSLLTKLKDLKGKRLVCYCHEDKPCHGDVLINFAELIGNREYYRVHPNGYEVSTKGDSRFSPLVAKLKDGRTIEEAYQLDIKGYRYLDSKTILPLIKHITFNSGGANGADFRWSLIAKRNGVNVINHWYHNTSKTPHGNINCKGLIDFNKALSEYHDLVDQLNRKPSYNPYIIDLMIRNIHLIDVSEEVFAIGSIISPEKGLVSGGTGYGVKYALNKGKRVYVYDLETNQWYSNGINSKSLYKCSSVYISSHKVAFIGTREVDENIDPVMQDIFDTTISKQGNEIVTDWKYGKGKLPKGYDTPEEVDWEYYYTKYLELYMDWIKQNPHMLFELIKGAKDKPLTDVFAYGIISQARALTDILNKFKL